MILRDNRVEVHYAVDADQCSTRPCGDEVIGIDKGYSEAFIDADGEVHGDRLGAVLSAESDSLKVKYQRRNKLLAIAEAKPKKAKHLFENNLGRKKLDSRKHKHLSNVKDIVFKAVHSVADKAKTIVCEDLSCPIANNLRYGKNQKRRLSGWVKGVMQDALESVSQRRGSTLVLVNCAYTSQMDSRHGVLLGHRQGDTFYCYDGVVKHADQNAARNILARANDPEIRVFTPFEKVKTILLERTEQFKKRLGLLNQDSSCRGQQLLLFPLSTESESP